MGLKAKLAQFLARRSLAIDSGSAINVFIEGKRGMLLGSTTNCDVVWKGDVMGCHIFGAKQSMVYDDGLKTTFRTPQ
jgi:hypothetical protein